MRTDKDSAELGADGFKESGEDIQDESLGWLLDIEPSEPEEKLFALDEGEYQEEGLSEYEAELAGRPLSRGHEGGDDLSLFVEEEIIISSQAQTGNIYSGGARNGADSVESAAAPVVENKAIDHSRKMQAAVAAPDSSVADGSDILGLADDDDMGEKFLTLKRVRSTGAGANGRSRKITPSLEPVDDRQQADTSAQNNTTQAKSEVCLSEDALKLPEVADNAVEEDLVLSTANGELGGVDLELTGIAAAGDAEELALPGGDEWLGGLELELGEVADTVAEEEIALPQADDWLGDVDLELAGSDVSQPEQAEASPAAEDWLGDVELELTEMFTPGVEEAGVSSQGDDLLGDIQFDLTESSAPGVEGAGVLAQTDDWLGEIELDLTELSNPGEEEAGVSAQADDWLGEVELDVTGSGAPGEEDASVSSQADDWLGEVELDVTGSGTPGEEAASVSSQADDWLGEAELDVTGSGTPPEEAASVSSQADDRLGEAELDVTGSGAPPEEAASVSSQADDWLGDIDLDVTGSGAPPEEAASVSSQADDWLGDIDLDVTGSGAPPEEAASVSSQADDWLGDIDLDVTGSGAPGVDEAASVLACKDDPADQNAGQDAVEQEATLSAGEEHTNSTVFLSEAPVTGFVAESGDRVVANEDPIRQESGDIDGVGEGSRDNVLDYVARHRPPSDEEEFDQYLLRGADLQGSAEDVDELEVERTDGIVSVDTSAGVPIDYHEDFRAMEGFEEGSVSAITSVIAEVMEEISGLVRARLEQLGRSAEALEVDVMLGTDTASVKQCYAEGFGPVTAICPELPSALQELSQAEVGSIYVRLFQGQTNENCNDLFSVDHDAAAGEPDVQGAEDATAEEPGTGAEAEMPETIFGEDIFNAEFLEDIDRQSVSGDIDALFEDLVMEESDGYLDVPLPPETESHNAQEVEGIAAQLPGDEMSEQPFIETAEAVPVAELAARIPGEAAVDEHAGFGEDIFNTELPGDLGDMAAGEADDIDTVFADLQLGEADTGEICGLDVDEFAETDDSNLLAAAVEVGETDSAVMAGQNDADIGWCIPEGITFNHTSVSSNEIFADFLDAFIEEGSATVEKLEDAIGEWERDVSSDAAFAPVARILHTLKGIAKGVGLQRYGTLVHNFETLLEKLPRPEAGSEAGYFRIVNAWLDATVRGLEFVRENRADVASELPAQSGATELSASPAAPDSSVAQEDDASENALDRQTVTQKIAARQKKRDQQLADEGAKVLAAQQSVRITSEKLDHLLNLTNQAQQLGVRSAQSTNRSKKASAELLGRLSSVRTHIAKIADRALLNVTARGGQQPSSDLDALEMDQYSELQEAANILREAVEDLADLVDVSTRHNAVVEAQLKQQATVISTIGSSIQAARVVPVSRLMPGLRRIVRTVSADLDKSVAFKVINETGALDRDHYARCQIILEHMVRNAMDHGIESPEERLAVGKSTTGRISIDVRKAGVDYFITLSDDGRGIDPYEMRESAFRKGLDIDVDALTDEEAIRLIFDKGLSTASAVSEISGRGVGMDIVLSELQQIGGDIQVSSKVGHGTTFELHIPANVTVNGALFVTAGESSYAIPLNGLIAVEQVPVADFFNAVELGKTLSLFDMDCEPAYLATLCSGESLPDRDTWGESVPVIIAGSPQRYMAIAIDNVEEALELVIRSLGAQFANVPGVAGGATTAEGQAIVALDLNLLVGSVAAGSLSPVSLDSGKDKMLLALVVDDSRTQRMVTTSQFDTVGVETITAENGLVAIDLLNTTHRLPDVVLLDVEMPVKDGIETLREIRKSVRYKHLPVIMVTSRTGAKHRAMAEEAGCNGYMGKPFNFPGLIKQINELTGYELHVS